MAPTLLLTRIASWSFVVIGVFAALIVLLNVHDDHGFWWAMAAFAAVVLPCIAVARAISHFGQRVAVKPHGRALAPGEARYCARCGTETRTFDPTCIFCGGTRFLPQPPTSTSTTHAARSPRSTISQQ